MSEQRIEHGASAATGSDADPEEGQGLARPGSHEQGIPHDEPGDSGGVGDSMPNAAPADVQQAVEDRPDIEAAIADNTTRDEASRDDS